MSSELEARIWAEELGTIGSRRRGVLRELQLPAPAATGDASDATKRQEAWERGDEDLHPPLKKAHRLRPFGVAFSGGGIRSATFNLGVLQGLAEHGPRRLGLHSFRAAVNGCVPDNRPFTGHHVLQVFRRWRSAGQRRSASARNALHVWPMGTRSC